MAPRKDYTPEQMGQAIEAVKKGEKVATAARQYGVPRITLLNKVTGKTPVSCTMGPATVLTQNEEAILVKWLLALCEKHFPITKETLLDSVQKIIINQGRTTPFTNNRPGKKWFQSFLKRHPELVEKTPENLTKGRDQVTETNIRCWFKEIEEYLVQRGLHEAMKNPRRVYNTDESAFFLSPKPGRVLAKRGEKHLYSSCGDEKDNLTVLITGNAAGELAPPMIVFSYERIPSNIAASIPDEWAVGKSESGWMCSNTFYEYMTNVFHPWLVKMEVEKPILFFVDGHKSHLTLHLSKFCSENGIEVIALYPNATHILQPMDLAVFRPLKVAWKKAVIEFKMENNGLNLRKENFAPVLKKALSSITEDCIKNGFRAGGLHPFGPDYIDMSKIKHREVTAANKTNPGQIEFLKYLESEIVKIFKQEKLNLFNKLYFENRNTVEDTLPPEDLALYLIWVKNKTAVTGSNTEPSNLMQPYPGPSSFKLPEVTVYREDDLPQALPTLAEITNKDSENTQKPQDTTIEVPANDEALLKETISEPQKDVYSDNSPKCKNYPVTVTKQTDDTLILDAIPVPSTSLSNKNITPQKRTIDHDLGLIVPSPFKKALFWPDPDISKKKSRMKKEKIPSAITSKAWKEYYEKKELEKSNQQLEKEKRAKQRNENKALKEKLAEERKNKAVKKVQRKRQINISSSEDSDMEIPYEESDDSYENDENENNQSRNVEKGCYVIVKYEGEYFPGKVLDTQKTQHEVSTMILSTGNSFRWPDKTDKIWYRHDDVIEIINEPVLMNKRGFYKVKEMEKYLPDIY